MSNGTGPAWPPPTLDPSDQQAHCLLGFRPGPAGLGLYRVVDIDGFRRWLSATRFTDAGDAATEPAANGSVQRNIVGSPGTELEFAL